MPLDERSDGTHAYELVLEDGCTVILLEGLHNRAEARSVARELTRHLERAIQRQGQRHVVVAIPPSVRLTVARGRRVKLETTEVGGQSAVRFTLQDGREQESPIILPFR